MKPIRALLMRSTTLSWLLPFTNPGAETGDTTGWTQRVGTNFVSASGGTSGTHSGSKKFILSTTDGDSEVFATALDAPAGALSYIDAGQVAASFSFWHGHFHDADTGYARLEFFSGAGATGDFLGARSSGALAGPDDGWAQFADTYVVPPGTRSFILYIFGYRSSIGGTELSFYWDDVQPLTLNIGYHSERVYSARTDTSGWTVDTGSGQPTNVNGSSWSFPGIAAGSQAAYAIHKDIAVSSLSAAAQAAISAGTATLHLHRYAWDTNGDDKTRTRCICRSSGADVATVQDAAATTQWGGSFANVDILRDATVAVPSTTDTFRFRLDYTRVDGTVLDARVSFPFVWLTW